MHAHHDEHENIAAMIDCGASETAASVERFESYPIEKTSTPSTTYLSAAGKQAENIVNVGQKHVRVVVDDGTESWTKFQMCKGLGQDKMLESVNMREQIIFSTSMVKDEASTNEEKGRRPAHGKEKF